MTARVLRHGRWFIAILLACFAVSVASICGDDASPTPPATTSATPQPTATPRAIDRAKLPVPLHVPNALDKNGTPSAAAGYPVGEYLHVVDMAAGTSRLVASAPLAHRPNSDFRPLLSADRGHVAYVSRGSIVVIDVASGGEQVFRLPTAAPTERPCVFAGIGMSWAPDSKRLALNTERALLVLDTDTGTYHVLVEHADVPGSCAVSWSPDGAWIVFTTRFSLVRIRPDGSDRFDGPTYYSSGVGFPGPGAFIWSPDSTRIFFGAEAFVEAWPANISFVSGLDLRPTGIPIGDTIAWQTPPMPPNPVRDAAFIQAVSASGTKAAYIRSDHDENWKWTSYLETRDIDGTNSRTLVTRPQISASIRDALFWSPDDTFVAYPQEINNNVTGPSGSARIVDPISGEDLAVAVGPDEVLFGTDGWERCIVFVVGWLSPTSLITLTTCGSI